LLLDLIFGYKATQCVYVAAKLDIADHLRLGAKSIDDLSQLTQSEPEPLYRVMRCLVSLGVFQELENKLFSLNKEAEKLLSDPNNTIKDYVILCGEELYKAAGELLYTVKTGKAGFEHAYGMNYWEYLNINSKHAAIFNNAMQKGSGLVINEILTHYDFAPYKTIVDIGGGKGHVVCAILGKYPHLTGVIFDMEHTRESAALYVTNKQLSNRCQIIIGDFFKSVPKEADLYILKVILHDWNDEKALRILKSCKKGMPNNSKLLIIEKLLDENQYIKNTCLSDINMLITLSGKERSFFEYKHLLEQAHFKVLKKIDTTTPFSIIEAAPLL
jgi:hypothetical protein